jgi:hypothetical protein
MSILNGKWLAGTGLLKQRLTGVQSVIAEVSQAVADVKVNDGDKIRWVGMLGLAWLGHKVGGLPHRCWLGCGRFGGYYVEARSTPGKAHGSQYVGMAFRCQRRRVSVRCRSHGRLHELRSGRPLDGLHRRCEPTCIDLLPLLEIHANLSPHGTQACHPSFPYMAILINGYACWVGARRS